MNNQVFRVASFSPIAWLWSITYIVGFVYFATGTVGAVMNGGMPQPLDLFMTVVVFGILLYAWMRSIRAYQLTDAELIIVRAGPGRMHIALGEILGAQAAPDIGTFFNIGILSIGGVFGWAGKARVRNPSDMKSLEADIYGTNPKYSVMLEMKTGRPLILTPADPVGFANALQRLGATAPVDVTKPQPPTPRPRSTAGTSPGANRGADTDPSKPKPWLQGNKK